MNYYTIIGTVFLMIGVNLQCHDQAFFAGVCFGIAVHLIVYAAKKEVGR